MLINIITPTLAINDFLLAAIYSVKCQSFLENKVKVVHYVVVDNEKCELPSNESIYNYNLIFMKVKGYGNGPSFTRNFALKSIDSGFVFFLDGDDLWRQDYLEKVIEIYNNKKVLSVSVIGKKMINSKITNYNAQVPACERIINRLILWNVIGCPSGFSFNLDLCTKKIFFNETLRYFEDWNFYLMLLDSNPGKMFYRTCKTNYYYRISDFQATVNINVDYVNNSFKNFHVNNFKFNWSKKFVVRVHLFRQTLKLSYGRIGNILSGFLLVANPEFIYFKISDLMTNFKSKLV